MGFEPEKRDLMSLLSEKYIMLRQMYERLWNERSSIHISPSEWHLLSRVGRMTHQSVASIAKDVSISRQATHKTLMSLREKGLIEVFAMPHNKRDKFVKPTQLGKQCYEEGEQLKGELESSVYAAIGQQNMQQLKTLLQQGWPQPEGAEIPVRADKQSAGQFDN